MFSFFKESNTIIQREKNIKSNSKYIYNVTKVIIPWSQIIIIMFIKQPNQHITMISEGSCDTEDWSAENPALQDINYIFKMY